MPLRPLRSTHRATLLTVAAGLAVAATVGLWLFQPWRIWTTTVVSEPPPVVAGSPPVVAGSPTGVADGSPAPARVVAAGDLRSLAHETSGRVQVIRLPDGSSAVRIEDLDTSDGPDLRVWLSDRPAAGAGEADDGRWLELGPLRGNRGSLTYPVPAGTDPADFSSLVIWCKRFAVGFGAAPLESA